MYILDGDELPCCADSLSESTILAAWVPNNMIICNMIHRLYTDFAHLLHCYLKRTLRLDVKIQHLHLTSLLSTVAPFHLSVWVSRLWLPYDWTKMPTNDEVKQVKVNVISKTYSICFEIAYIEQILYVAFCLSLLICNEYMSLENKVAFFWQETCVRLIRGISRCREDKGRLIGNRGEIIKGERGRAWAKERKRESKRVHD